MELREIVARAIADADRAFRGLEPMSDGEWRNYWSPGGPAALPSAFAMRADAAIAAMWPVIREMCAKEARTAALNMLKPDQIADTIRNLEQPK